MSTMRFCLDFISPYAYLGWTQIHALAARQGRRVEPVPVLFAAMLDHWGHRGPAEIPPKRLYVFKDVLRTAHVLGLPLEPPPSHPFNPLLGLRVASLPMAPETRRALIDALFGATWGGGPGITEPETVDQIAWSVGVEHAVERATTPEGKQRVKDQTASAIEAGVFGVPTVLVDDELFWGLDAFAHLERYLAGRDALPEDLLERWAHIRPSASRS